jgi:hypothetical protein
MVLALNIAEEQVAGRIPCVLAKNVREETERVNQNKTGSKTFEDTFEGWNECRISNFREVWWCS